MGQYILGREGRGDGSVHTGGGGRGEVIGSVHTGGGRGEVMGQYIREEGGER